MGCFPDRTLPQYKPMSSEHDRLIKRSANPNKNIDTLYVPIDVNESQTTPRPFNKAQRTSPKKAKAHPVGDEHRQSSKFSRKQASVMKIDDADKQRRINRKRTAQHRVPVDRKKGKLIQSPYQQHIITEIETPSESVRTSVLANFENNPSIFFLKMNEKDLDTIFNKSTDRQDDKCHRLSYKSMSPMRIRSQASS